MENLNSDSLGSNTKCVPRQNDAKLSKEWDFRDKINENDGSDSFVEIELVESKTNGDQILKANKTYDAVDRRLLTVSSVDAESECSSATIRQMNNSCNESISTTASSHSKGKHPLLSRIEPDDSVLRVPVASAALSISAPLRSGLRSKSAVEEWIDSVAHSEAVSTMETKRRKINSENRSSEAQEILLPALPFESKVTNRSEEFVDALSTSGSDRQTDEFYKDDYESLDAQKKGSLQDSGYADAKTQSSDSKQTEDSNPRGSISPATSQDAVHEFDYRNTSPDDATVSSNGLFKNVDFLESERLCAPVAYPCSHPSSSLPHSLQGVISNTYSKDAMLQGLIGDQKSCVDMVAKDANALFLVDSKPSIVCVDVDKCSVRLIDSNENRNEILTLESSSKTVEDSLTNAHSLLNMRLKPHCCVRLIERSLHCLVMKSVALSSKLLDHNDPLTLLTTIGVHKSDVILLTAIASCIRHINSQD